MERQLHCAEQPVWLSNLTKDCTCHEKSFAWLILLTFQTSFTMRRATRLTLQPHQIMRTATGLTLQPHEIRRLPHNSHDWCSWHVTRSYIARSNKSHLPNSPNTVPATANDSHDWLRNGLLRHILSHMSKPVITLVFKVLRNGLLRYIILTHVQACDKVRVQSATQWTASNMLYHCSHLKRHLDWAEQQHSPSNVTKHRACHA